MNFLFDPFGRVSSKSPGLADPSSVPVNVGLASMVHIVQLPPPEPHIRPLCCHRVGPYPEFALLDDRRIGVVSNCAFFPWWFMGLAVGVSKLFKDSAGDRHSTFWCRFMCDSPPSQPGVGTQSWFFCPLISVALGAVELSCGVSMYEFGRRSPVPVDQVAFWTQQAPDLLNAFVQHFAALSADDPVMTVLQSEHAWVGGHLADSSSWQPRLNTSRT